VRQLEQRVVIVTGGTRGIDLGIAQVMIEQGAAVAVWGRDAEVGATAERTLSDHGEGQRLPADVTSERGCEWSFGRRARTLRLRHRAGQQRSRNAACTDSCGVARWAGAVALERLRADQRDGSDAVCQACRTGDRRPRCGSVVNINSISAIRAGRGGSAYGMTKSTLGALTRSIAVEFAPAVRCNEIVLGFTEGGDNPRTTAMLQDEAVHSAMASCIGRRPAPVLLATTPVDYPAYK
jgi:NAD(P)-dependent dehydrogenase (short-subunit alcohol dehydrogenase family)